MQRHRDPILLGLPSPSLRKMQRMTLDELAAHIERIVTEAGHVERRIAALREETENPDAKAHIEMLEKQLHRLKTLEQMGRDRLEGKPPRDEPDQTRSSRPRPSHSNAPRRSSSYERGSSGYSGGNNPRRQGPPPPQLGGGYR
jgi:hypothetical protein